MGSRPTVTFGTADKYVNISRSAAKVGQETVKTGSEVGKTASEIGKTSAEFAKNSDPVGKFEWHHIIPRALRFLQQVKNAEKGGFKFNKIKDNLIRLSKFSRATGQGRHGCHNKYTEQIAEKIEQDIPKNSSPSEAAEGLRKIAEEARKVIENNPEKKINDLKLY